MSIYAMSGKQFTSYLAGIKSAKKTEDLLYDVARAAAYQARWYGNFDAPERAAKVAPKYAKDWFNNLCGKAREAHDKFGILKDAGWTEDQIAEHLDNLAWDAVMMPYEERQAMNKLKKEKKKAEDEEKKKAQAEQAQAEQAQAEQAQAQNPESVYLVQNGQGMELSADEAAAVLDLIQSIRNTGTALKVVNG